MSLLIHHFPARNWRHAIYFFCLGMWFRQISSIDHLAVKNAPQQDSPAQCSRNSSKKKSSWKSSENLGLFLCFAALQPSAPYPQKKNTITLGRNPQQNTWEHQKKDNYGITECEDQTNRQWLNLYRHLLQLHCCLCMPLWQRFEEFSLKWLAESKGRKEGRVFGSYCTPSCFTWCMCNDPPTFPSVSSYTDCKGSCMTLSAILNLKKWKKSHILRKDVKFLEVNPACAIANVPYTTKRMANPTS